MKKALLLAILGLALTTVICTPAISPAKAWIEDFVWIGQVHAYDPYWDANHITVFPEESNATLLVWVYNNYVVQLNVSAVKVWLDWNQNYSSTECSVNTPVAMSSGSYRIFTVTFEVPSTSEASNRIMHHYTIYVEEVNATTGPKQVSLHDREDGSGFVVYSAIQKEAQVLYDELTALVGIGPSFESDEAASLWYNGTLEYELGENAHQVGDFSGAKAHYETAHEMLYQALSTETSYEKYWEDYDRTMAGLDTLERQAEIAYQQALATAVLKEADAAVIEANATKRQADAAVIEADAAMRQADADFAEAEAIKTQAVGWVVFGIGFVVFGIAAVVWAYRRPIHPSEKT